MKSFYKKTGVLLYFLSLFRKKPAPKHQKQCRFGLKLPNFALPGILQYCKVRNICLLTSFALVIATLFLNSYAWFYNTDKSDVNSIGTTDDYPVTLEKSVYDHENGSYSFAACNTVTDSFDTSITANDTLDFGKMDDISALNDSNYVYLKATVLEPAGEFINFGVSYSEKEPFEIFYKPYIDDDYAEISESTQISASITGRDIINNLTGKAFFKCEYVVSSDELSFEQLKLQSYTAIDGSDKTESLNFSADSGKCYIYIRMYPDLDVFMENIDTFMTIMPCYFNFNIKARFEAAEKEEYLNAQNNG